MRSFFLLWQLPPLSCMKLGAYDDTYILFFFFYQSSEAVLGTGGRCPRWHFSGEVSGRQMPEAGANIPNLSDPATRLPVCNCLLAGWWLAPTPRRRRRRRRMTVCHFEFSTPINSALFVPWLGRRQTSRNIVVCILSARVAFACLLVCLFCI